MGSKAPLEGCTAVVAGEGRRGQKMKDWIWCWWGGVGKERRGADEDGGRTDFSLLLLVSRTGFALLLSPSLPSPINVQRTTFRYCPTQQQLIHT